MEVTHEPNRSLILPPHNVPLINIIDQCLASNMVLFIEEMDGPLGSSWLYLGPFHSRKSSCSFPQKQTAIPDIGLPFLPEELQATPLCRVLKNALSTSIQPHVRTSDQDASFHSTRDRGGAHGHGIHWLYTWCTIHNATGHHRTMGLPIESRAEVPAQRQNSVRMECHTQGFSIYTESKTSIWYCIPTWIWEPRSANREVCISQPFSFGLCTIRMAQRGHTLATQIPLQRTQKV